VLSASDNEGVRPPRQQRKQVDAVVRSSSNNRKVLVKGEENEGGD